MSRKDYIEFADMIAHTKHDISAGFIVLPETVLKTIEQRLIRILMQDNERFDLEKFKEACRS